MKETKIKELYQLAEELDEHLIDIVLGFVKRLSHHSE